MATDRINKVNSLLEHEIGQIMQREISFPNGVLVTLTHVQATANLIEAKAYISVLPEEKTEQVLKILKNEVADIQHKINKKLNMRPIPKIMFAPDRMASEADKVEKLLSQLKKDEK